MDIRAEAICSTVCIGVLSGINSTESKSVRAFSFLTLMNPRITPPVSKVHLVEGGGQENPLHLYLTGKFEEWQRWQERRNFERSYVISLIRLPESSRWLFAGVYLSGGAEVVGRGQYYYRLTEDPACSGMSGRLIVTLGREVQQRYINAEHCANDMSIAEVMADRYSMGQFPGFKSIDISKTELDLLILRSIDSWRVPLSGVAGVYLVSDTQTGELFVSSAAGEGGIWRSWCDCASSGHGGNPELRRLLVNDGIDRANAFRYSILEIADVRASHEDMLEREHHWRKVLLSGNRGPTGRHLIAARAPRSVESVQDHHRVVALNS